MTTATTGSAPAPITVLVVDASDFSRACTVAGLGSAAELAIEACAAIAQADRDIEPDLILFQSTEPAAGGGSALPGQLALAAQWWPNAASLVVASHIDLEEMLGLIRAGAHGLLTSTTSVACMRSAILLLVNAIGVYPRELADYLRREPKEAPPAAAPTSPFELGRLDTLTKRQQDVLQLLALGFSNKAIAQRLEISESTVKVHIRAIMAQNGATNRTQIVAHFLKGITHEQ